MQATKLKQSICSVTYQVNKQAMQGVKPRQPTPIVDKQKKVRVWHSRFGHASNARIIRALKFFTSIEDFDNVCNLTEVYSNSKQFNANDNKDAKTVKNLEEPTQARKIFGNSKEKKTRLENPEKSAHARKTLNRSGRNVESTTFPALKILALITTAKDGDLDSICTSYIASK